MGKSFKQMHDESINHPAYWAEYLSLEIQDRVWRSKVLKDHRKHLTRLIDKATEKIWRLSEGVEDDNR